MDLKYGGGYQHTELGAHTRGTMRSTWICGAVWGSGCYPFVGDAVAATREGCFQLQAFEAISTVYRVNGGYV